MLGEYFDLKRVYIVIYFVIIWVVRDGEGSSFPSREVEEDGHADTMATSITHINGLNNNGMSPAQDYLHFARPDNNNLPKQVYSSHKLSMEKFHYL